MLDINDETSVIPVINTSYYKELKSPLAGHGGAKIFAGMIPKLDNAFAALDAGVKKVIIGNAQQLAKLVEGTAGTMIINE